MLAPREGAATDQPPQELPRDARVRHEQLRSVVVVQRLFFHDVPDPRRRPSLELCDFGAATAAAGAARGGHCAGARLAAQPRAHHQVTACMQPPIAAARCECGTGEGRARERPTERSCGHNKLPTLQQHARRRARRADGEHVEGGRVMRLVAAKSSPTSQAPTVGECLRRFSDASSPWQPQAKYSNAQDARLSSKTGFRGNSTKYK